MRRDVASVTVAAIVPLGWLGLLSLVVLLFGSGYGFPMIVGFGLGFGLVVVPILFAFVRRRGIGVAWITIGSLLPITTIPLVACQGGTSLSSFRVVVRSSLSYGLWPGPAYQVYAGGCTSAIPLFPLAITWLLVATGLATTKSVDESSAA